METLNIMCAYLIAINKPMAHLLLVSRHSLILGATLDVIGNKHKALLKFKSRFSSKVMTSVVIVLIRIIQF